ncbi:hypothetical protein KQX54_010013 [Cotesia glomerata]|uniref:Uncharacterized protein n=1 Tax=Cotesia glomerata TaxID=32391 RepID=A0AAV7IB13_COTGL|nr:hypothetical protein KQX54_010013 [Cotesia glomerata]
MGIKSKTLESQGWNNRSSRTRQNIPKNPINYRADDLSLLDVFLEWICRGGGVGLSVLKRLFLLSRPSRDEDEKAKGKEDTAYCGCSQLPAPSYQLLYRVVLDTKQQSGGAVAYNIVSSFFYSPNHPVCDSFCSSRLETLSLLWSCSLEDGASDKSWIAIGDSMQDMHLIFYRSVGCMDAYTATEETFGFILRKLGWNLPAYATTPTGILLCT